MMIDLKPCPFCGGKATVFINGGVKVICTKCRAQTETRVDFSIKKEGVNTSLKNSIESWNRRTQLKEDSNV